MPKKVTRVLAILLVLCLVFSTAVLAQTTKKTQTVEGLKQQIRIPQVKKLVEAEQAEIEEDKVSKAPFDGKTLENLMAKAFTMIAIGSVEEDPADGKAKFSGGLIPTTSTLIASMYGYPAASTQTYVAHVLDSTQIVPQAYAQGIGFSALDPILSIWVILRNIAYFFFVAIFVAIGFMIMFRQKISGQAVVTAQQAIPSIIIALIMVTFSYAIAGFMIDLMYLTMYLIVGLFQGSQDLINGNFLEVAGNVVIGSGTDVATVVDQFVVGSLGDNVIGEVAGVLSGLTIAIIFAVAIAIVMFRLFFNLLKRYVAIIISVTFAPVILMVGAIPGRNTFGPWLKGIIGNLAAFPVLLLALVISDILTTRISVETSTGFMPPYLIGSGTGNIVAFLVGFGILLVLPELVDKVTQALGAGKSPFDELVGAAWKNLRAGDEAIPIATAGYGALQGAVSGGLAAARSRENVGIRDIFRAARRGYEERDEEGHLIRTVGGAIPRAQRGLQFGTNVRRTITDLEKGRLWQTDNYAKILQDIRQAQLEGGKKDDKEKGEQTETPVA